MNKQFTQEITLDEMESELKREIAMRQRVFPSWVENGKLSAQTAKTRILILEAILILIQAEIRKNAPQGDLFGNF